MHSRQFSTRLIAILLVCSLIAIFSACTAEPPFESGKSAYEIAVENGFVGTEAEWLASLKNGSAPAIVDVTVLNGEVIVTFSDGTRQNLGSLLFETEGSLSFLPLPDGSFAVAAVNTEITGSVTVPATYKGKPVTRVLARGFASCRHLFSLTLPDSITAIGEDALIGCENILSLSLPFLGAEATDAVSAHLGYLFGAATPQQNKSRVPASLERLVLTSATTLAERALLDCEHLTELVLPQTLTEIGATALAGCGNLSSLTLPFIGRTPDDTENGYIGYLFGAAAWTEHELTVPQTLTSITLTAETEIAPYAFYAAAGLRTVVLPETLSLIGKYAFAHCPLEAVYMDTDAGWKTDDGTPILLGTAAENAALLTDTLCAKDWLCIKN